MTEKKSNTRPIVINWCATALVLIAAGGCGTSHGLPLVPVSGQITFAGGPCPAAGTVTYSPIEIDAGLPRRPGSATFYEDGAFVVTTFKQGDGILPGRYKTTISCNSGLPDPRSADPWGDVSYIAKDYQSPELIVTAGSDPIVVNYDVTPKKPAP